MVSYGEDLFEPGEFGTSFAVSHASREVLLLTAFVLQLEAEQARLDGHLAGVPILLQCTFDYGGVDDPRSHKLPMLPDLGVDRDAYRSTIELLNGAGVTVRPVARPRVIRDLLVASARPMTGYGAHEVGYGFVGGSTSFDLIERFDGLDLARLFGEGVDKLSAGQQQQLRSRVISRPSDLPTLDALARGSTISYHVDLGNGSVTTPMRDPGMRGTPDRWWTAPPSGPAWPMPIDFDSYDEPETEYPVDELPMELDVASVG